MAKEFDEKEVEKCLENTHKVLQKFNKKVLEANKEYEKLKNRLQSVVKEKGKITDEEIAEISKRWVEIYDELFDILEE